MAEAKWAPKTSAVVVPALASAVRNSPAMTLGVRVLGEPGLLGQRALLQPVQQRHAQPGERPDLRVVHVRVDHPRQQHAAPKIDDLFS